MLLPSPPRRMGLCFLPRLDRRLFVEPKRRVDRRAYSGATRVCHHLGHAATPILSGCLTDGQRPPAPRDVACLFRARCIVCPSRIASPHSPWHLSRKGVSMRLSRYFLPILRDTPKEAEIVSHRLMLRAGLIRQQAAGIYSWLPLGKRVLTNIERIVREEQDRSGAIEILMPTIQSADLWRESGRYDDYGKEMLRIEDRHERQMLFGPTNEEMVTDIFRAYINSYRALPLNLYHIQWKFRDEVRPRFGVMRGREFLMKDAYSFDVDYAAARHSYNKMFVAYRRTFPRLDWT